MSLRDLGLLSSYAGSGKKILNDYLLPALRQSIQYDRITGYYSVESLVAISQGLQSIWERGGKVRLLIGIQSVPRELLDVVAQKRALEAEVVKVRQSLINGLSTITDELVSRRLATIAWMIEDGLMTVKAAASKSGGIFHAKTMLFYDGRDSIAAIGSLNETAFGLGANFEQIVSLNSWNMPDDVRVQQRFFDEIWCGDNQEAVVCDITEEICGVLREGLGRACDRSDVAPASSVDVAAIGNLPSSFFVSEMTPGLFQHQERAVLEALSRWPIRVMFADEVGLGKTFEAAATIAFLRRFCSVNRVLILTPKAVLRQWQQELDCHFGICAWIYDSARKVYVSPAGDELPAAAENPLSSICPEICLMSSQYARGGGRRRSVFSHPAAVLPDLLVVDEAHAARVSKDVSGKQKKTLLYSALESVAGKIPHMIFATATPMQKEPEEYHAMLRLLGLPKPWQSAEKYTTSLQLIVNEQTPGLDDSVSAARLLLSVVDCMSPSLESLDEEERRALFDLTALRDGGKSGIDLGQFVQQKWKDIRPLLIRLHPAHLLTVRNTRRSLQEVGYVFPVREMNAVSVEVSLNMQKFMSSVDLFLQRECFAVEDAIYPNRRWSLGFVRVGYRQRVASSLHSCRETLRRRAVKVRNIREALVHGSDALVGSICAEEFENASNDESIQLDEQEEGAGNGIDRSAVLNACNREWLSLDALIREADQLIAVEGDLKISRALKICAEHLEVGDSILVFSRYSDTVDALLCAARDCPVIEDACYGVYDGSRSFLHICGDRKDVGKEQLTLALRSGTIRILFCTDAASEGLNLQAAQVLINVDVPWTPSRLEQRIGRIARLGQKAAIVHVYNIWYPNSIEARMYSRVQSRFESLSVAIGEFPDVVADSIVRALDGDAIDDGLDELQDLRNSYQTAALERLWATDGNGVTETQAIRLAMMNRLKESVPHEELSPVETLFHFGYGSDRILASEVGAEASPISLDTEGVGTAIGVIKGYHFLESPSIGRYAVAIDGDSEHWIPLTDVLLNRDKTQCKVHSLTERPALVPNTGALRTGASLNIEEPSRPIFWPEVE